MPFITPFHCRLVERTVFKAEQSQYIDHHRSHFFTRYLLHFPDQLSKVFPITFDSTRSEESARVWQDLGEEAPIRYDSLFPCKLGFFRNGRRRYYPLLEFLLDIASEYWWIPPRHTRAYRDQLFENFYTVDEILDDFFFLFCHYAQHRDIKFKDRLFPLYEWSLAVQVG